MKPFRNLSVAMAIMVSLFTPAAMAQELWQGSEVGDTVEDILAKFPDAERLAEPMAYSEGRAAKVIIDQRKIGSDIFDARFIMIDGGLDSVALVLGAEETGEKALEPTFHSLEEVLSRKYGAPLYEMPAKMYDPGFLRMLKNEFRQGDLTVRVACFMCSKDDGTISIVYSYAAVEEASEF